MSHCVALSASISEGGGRVDPLKTQGATSPQIFFKIFYFFIFLFGYFSVKYLYFAF